MSNSSNTSTLGKWIDRIATFAHVASIFVVVYKLAPENWASAEGLAIFVLALGILFLIIANFILSLEHKRERKAADKEHEKEKQTFESRFETLINDSKYKHLTSRLADSFLPVHRAMLEKNRNAQMILESLNRFCSELRSCLTELKGGEIYICVRVVNENGQIRSLCATDPSMMKEGASDIRFHTSMLHIQNLQDDECYMNNNLPTDLEYKNPVFKYHKKDTKYSGVPKADEDYYFFKPSATLETRKQYWPLKFRSTIVAPIKAESTLGYLSVGSSEVEVFNEDDKKIWHGCAQGITSSLNELFLLSEISVTEAQPATLPGSSIRDSRRRTGRAPRRK